MAIARDRSSEQARKACGAADYPIGPCGSALFHCPRHCSPSGTRSKNYILIHPIEPTAISPVKYLILFLLLIIGPVVISAANYLMGERRGNWQTADRSSAGLLPDASEHPNALIRVYAASRPTLAFAGAASRRQNRSRAIRLQSGELSLHLIGKAHT